MTGRDDCVRLIAERLVEIFAAAHGWPPADIDELETFVGNAGALGWTGRPHSPARVRASSMSDWARKCFLRWLLCLLGRGGVPGRRLMAVPQASPTILPDHRTFYRFFAKLLKTTVIYSEHGVAMTTHRIARFTTAALIAVAMINPAKADIVEDCTALLTAAEKIHPYPMNMLIAKCVIILAKQIDPQAAEQAAEAGRAIAAAPAKRDAASSKWEEFCKPQLVTDPHGVQSYVYAHEGCEHGRTQ
jgi:hypothetical protein